MLGGWIADLVPRDPKSDENGNTAAPTSMTINVVGVEPGRFLSRAEAHASVWGEQLPLLEHDSAVVIEHDAPDPVGADDDEPPSAA